jgi:uracil-DNA glycosylase
MKNKSLPIGQAHGVPREYPALPGVMIFPLYHPASVIYRRELATVYEADLRLLSAFCAHMFTNRSSNMN